jgi:hypothetical protein
MNFVPKVKFDDSLGNTISLAVDEDFIDGYFVKSRRYPSIKDFYVSVVDFPRSIDIYHYGILSRNPMFDTLSHQLSERKVMKEVVNTYKCVIHMVRAHPFLVQRRHS